MCNLSEGVLERGIAQGRAEGEAKGEAKAKLNMLINAYNMNLDMEQMKGLTGLDEDEIRSILKSKGYDI